MIIRGTTQHQFFRLPFSWGRIKEVYVDYMQQKEVILEKAYNDRVQEIFFDRENQAIRVFLTKNDTMNFKKIGIPASPADSLIYIQVHVHLCNGEWYSSVPIKDRLYDTTREVL